MKRLLNHIDALIRTRDSKTSQSVHPAGEFAAILNRERDRTDRTGKEFSLVAFDGFSARRKCPATRNLVDTLSKRIRSTDDIGWLADGRLAVVLPHTAPDGAWEFVDNVRRSFDGTIPWQDCIVYAYPSWWIGQEGVGSPEPEKGDKPTSPPKTGTPEMQRSAVKTRESASPVEDLESQFLCRIPTGKRAFDIAGSLMATVLLAPLLAGVALLIKVVSPGPILFRQERVGYLGRKFTLWKFRTMHMNADTSVHKDYLLDLIHNETQMTKLDNGRDRRIIPLGGILRAAGIDELPQLLNVLRGEMSLIGPRPCLPYEAREFDTWQKRRFDTVPGLTGLWQVSGKNRTTFKEMMRLDIGYARKRAILLDLKIFLKTIPAVVEQVLDRPALAPVRAKMAVIAVRTGMVFMSLIALSTSRK